MKQEKEQEVKPLNMKKTEVELVKVVRALTIMFTHSCTTFFSSLLTPEQWIAGHRVKVKLVPSTSKDPSALAVFKVEKTAKDSDIVKPDMNRVEIVPKRLYDFVAAIRKQFTSIHDIPSNMLELSITTVPSEEDLSWAEEVCKSYGVELIKNKQLMIKLKNEEDQLAMIDTIPEEGKFIEILSHLQTSHFLIGPHAEKYPNKISQSKAEGTIEIHEY